MTGLAGNGAFAAGSDKPEKDTLKVGFMPLTDCASLVMASVLGFDERYGIRIVLSKEHSWSGMRDRLASGELDAAHVLYGLLYGVQMGIGTAPKAMAVLMNLNRNGQSITLSRSLAERGARDGPGLAALVRNERRRFTFAHTFPTGNHAMLLYYWLAAAGIDPLRDATVLTVPPGQTNVPFVHIEEDVSFPLPNPSELSAYVVYVGFDPALVKEPEKKPPPKNKPRPSG
ncbi:MAG: CmpA/NrtA family ABC transporter substrate-binding protein [Massilia sp.]